MPLPESYGERSPDDRRREGRHARELVRRLLPGDHELLRQHGGRARSWLRMYPEFQVPDDQKKAWLADRAGRHRRRRSRRSDSAGRSAIASRSRPRSSGDRTTWRWEFNIDGIYDSPVKGTDKTQLFFHYDYLDEVLRTCACPDRWAGT